VVNAKERKIRIFNREAKLSLRQMFVYAMFAYFRKNNIGENGFAGLDGITTGDLERVCRLFVDADEDDSAIDLFCERLKRSKFIYNFDPAIVRDDLLEFRRKNYLKLGLKSPRDAVVTREEAGKKVGKSYRETLDRISENLVAAKIDLRYDIRRKGDKGGYIFGLEIEPRKIVFE